ncbi:hypothetical protein ACWEGE_14565 [Amycolatopsis sp. NPDC004747]
MARSEPSSWFHTSICAPSRDEVSVGPGFERGAVAFRRTIALDDELLGGRDGEIVVKVRLRGVEGADGVVGPVRSELAASRLSMGMLASSALVALRC